MFFCSGKRVHPEDYLRKEAAREELARREAEARRPKVFTLADLEKFAAEGCDPHRFVCTVKRNGKVYFVCMNCSMEMCIEHTETGAVLKRVVYPHKEAV